MGNINEIVVIVVHKSIIYIFNIIICDVSISCNVKHKLNYCDGKT